ncbi:MAG: NUDIX hydrolase [Clostridiales bacterium]|nr:NUDIX hydrolase [Clostridiales bacterium]
MHLNEIMIKTEEIYDGKIFKVTRDTVLLENKNNAIREVVHHSGGVCVVPITDNNEVILVKQFRYPFQEAILEIPAGKLNPNENHYECGLRELLEETGAVPNVYSYLGTAYPTPAYVTEKIHIYLAKGLTFKEQKLDDDEFLDVIRIPFDEAINLVMDNKICDAKTQIALLKTYILTREQPVK